MSAAKRAAELKEEEMKKNRQEAEQAEADSKARKARREVFIRWIEEALNSFGMSVDRRWFAGSDYWVVRKGADALCSCALTYERGTWDASDDCRGLPWEGWQITVCRGVWSGPAGGGDNVVMRGISDQKTLEECVARVMMKHI